MSVIVFGTAALGFAFPTGPQAREARIAAMPVEAEEPGESSPAIPEFSGDQLQRLRQLRAWLERRKQERQPGGVIDPDVKPSRQLTVSSDRQLLTPLGQRYALGFEKNRRAGSEVREPPILRIGRGPDGRIHHRYVFRDPEQAELGAETPSAAEFAASRSSAGSIAHRQRIVRVWVPESPDQTSAPRLEYESSDPRR